MQNTQNIHESINFHITLLSNHMPICLLIGAFIKLKIFFLLLTTQS